MENEMEIGLMTNSDIYKSPENKSAYNYFLFSLG